MTLRMFIWGLCGLTLLEVASCGSVVDRTLTDGRAGGGLGGSAGKGSGGGGATSVTGGKGGRGGEGVVSAGVGATGAIDSNGGANSGNSGAGEGGEPHGGGMSGAGNEAGGGVSGELGAGAAGAPSGPRCGDGRIDGGERCDDGNTDSGDGCSSTCRIETGWNCDDGEPTGCTEVCGDGRLVGHEAIAGGCDDKNNLSHDGCSATCKVEAGYACTGAPSTCMQTCGNGKLDPGETCEDGNTTAGDGCNSCAEEVGYSCDNTQLPSTCSDIDECATETDNCSPKATCANTTGSFTCTCKTGYSGDGTSCVRTSCAGMSGTECQGGDCCASHSVTGGSFQQGIAGAAGSGPGGYVSIVGTYDLDLFEVTVGRFRNFVKAYDAWLGAGNPASGASASPYVTGSGWNTSWASSLPADSAGLKSDLQCSASYQTWSDTGNSTLPINCVDWYEAFAFCSWDGGRLPTESEWEFAARGGASDYAYPWGNSPSPDNTLSTGHLAVYECLGDGNASCSAADILPVGSRPDGRGTFLQLDLAGSVSEWALDWYATYPTSTTSNYAHLFGGTSHVLRGGGWDASDSFLQATNRSAYDAVSHDADFGFRCARAPEM